MSKTAVWIALIVVLASGFALRAGYIIQIEDNPFFEPVDPGLDTYLYDSWAQALAEGDWVGDGVFWAMPGYPYFLGAIYRIFGRDLLLARLIQAFLGTLTCFLIFLIGRRRFGSLPGLIAAFLAAAYQMFVFHDAILVSSNLSIFLNCLGLYFLTIALERRQWRHFAVSGVVFGAAALTSASVVVFILLAAGWLARRTKVSFGAIFLITAVLTVLPVTVRNYIVGGDLVPITAHGGINFYIGNNPSSRGVYQAPALMMGSARDLIKDSRTFAEKDTGRKLKPSEVSRFWFGKGMSFIRDNPPQYLALTIRKAGLFINAEEINDILDTDMMKPYSSILRLPLIRFGWLLPLAVIGIFASWPLLKGKRLLCLFFASQMISCCLFFVNARYRLPAVIALSVFAGYAVSWLIEAFRRRRLHQAAVAVFAGIVICAVSYTPLYRKDSGINLYNVALAHQKQGRLEETERLLLESVRVSPNFAEAYNALASLCRQLGRKKEAVAYYKKALSIGPYFAEARNNLGCIYLEDGDLENAEGQFEMALSIKPDYTDALVNMGLVCARRGNYEAARGWWLKALESEPGNAMARKNLELLERMQPGQQSPPQEK